MHLVLAKTPGDRWNEFADALPGLVGGAILFIAALAALAAVILGLGSAYTWAQDNDSVVLGVGLLIAFIAYFFIGGWAVLIAVGVVLLVLGTW